MRVSQGGSQPVEKLVLGRVIFSCFHAVPSAGNGEQLAPIVQCLESGTVAHRLLEGDQLVGSAGGVDFAGVRE